MSLNTVIFDMDGLLIDSEPLWQEAGQETLAAFGILLSEEQYHSSTGLRTPEWIDHWFTHFKIDKTHADTSIQTIERTALDKIKARAQGMKGVTSILEFFSANHFRIGLASSSPMRFIEAVVEKLRIGSYLHTITSAEGLPYGKPHPQVFIECAKDLNASPSDCVVFEDSFNGMIAAKAAKMKCVVVPHPGVASGKQWGAADMILQSLDEFNLEKLQQLSR